MAISAANAICTSKIYPVFHSSNEFGKCSFRPDEYGDRTSQISLGSNLCDRSWWQPWSARGPSYTESHSTGGGGGPLLLTCSQTLTYLHVPCMNIFQASFHLVGIASQTSGGDDRTARLWSLAGSRTLPSALLKREGAESSSLAAGLMQGKS